VAGAAWHAATRVVAGVGDLEQRTGDGRTGRVLGGRAIERSGGVVCSLHCAHGDEECGLCLKTKVDSLSVVWPQNHWDSSSSVWASKPMAMVCEWVGLKTTQTVFAGLAPKSVATISGGLASKPAATVSSGLA
jgi:hypothetical protein